MNDAFVKWFSGIINVLLALRILAWLWMHFPLGLIFLAVGALLITRNILGERRLRQQRGWWVEYLSPGLLRAGADDFGLVYHEGDNQHFFYGQERPRPALNVLTVPSEVRWDEQVPMWMHGRSREILGRMDQEVRRWRKEWRVEVVAADE